MTEEFIDEREIFEDEEYSEEELGEIEPEMQGFVVGWREAGTYKKERRSDDLDDSSEEY